jgi:tetratricopeptide (TPR) repeat protein
MTDHRDLNGVSTSALTQKLTVLSSVARSWKLVALVLGISGLSLLIAPTGDDLISLVHANSDHADEALFALEKQVASGDRTAHTIGALARAKARRGDLDGAIEHLKSWLQDHPKDSNAKRFFDELKKQSQERTNANVGRTSSVDSLVIKPTDEEEVLSMSTAQLNNVLSPKIQASVGDETSPSQATKHQINQAQRALQIGDRIRAHQLTKLAVNSNTNWAENSLDIARLFAQLDEPTLARSVLRQNVKVVNQSVWLIEFARLHITLKQAEEGLETLKTIGQSDRGVGWMQAWSLLATSIGQSTAVIDWLNSNTGLAAKSDYYRDLMYLAMDTKAYPLASLAAQSLQRSSTQVKDLLAVSSVLLESGNAPAALPIMRQLNNQKLISSHQYRQWLEHAWRAGAPVANELHYEMLALIKSRPVSELTQPDLNTLLSLGAYREALPIIERLVEKDPERWLGLFNETAERSGQVSSLIPLWKRLADAPSTPSALRIQIAFRLLEVGEKASAETCFRALAANATIDDPATRQLLYIWGPRPRPHELDWLVMRAVTANQSSKAGWLRLLNERGGATRVIQIVMERYTELSAQGHSIQESLSEVYLDALTATNNRSTLKSYIRDRLNQVQNAAELAVLVRHAVGLSDPLLDRKIIDSARLIEISDLKLEKILGFIAYRLRDLKAAELWLVKVNTSEHAEYESHRRLGEIYQSKGNTTAARTSFETALNFLEKNSISSPNSAQRRATILSRLGRTKEARDEYLWLLQMRPQDDEIRAELSALLVSQGDIKSAQSILGQDPQ